MSSRDFGGSAIYGDNMPSNNFDDNHNQYQGGSPIRINSNVNPSYFERSLIPTTIKKILNEKTPGPDQAFTIDGKPVHQVSIIGMIDNINPQSTHTLFTIDDQKCKLKCKLWSSDNDDIKQLNEEKLKEGDLVKVIGKIDTFKNLRSINIHHIEKITNYNNIALHGLEIILSHELNELIVNQHLPTQKKRYQQWIDRAKHEEFQRNKSYQEYKESQQNQSPQKGFGQSPQRGNFNQNRNQNQNQAQNHNHNRNYNNMNNQNSNNNQSQSGGFHRNSNHSQSSNRFVSHKSNNNGHGNGDNLTEWEKKILKWMKVNVDSQAGRSREVIKTMTKCYNEQIFAKSMKSLLEKGYITDTLEDYYANVD